MSTRKPRIEMQIGDSRVPVDTMSLDDTKMWLSTIELSVAFGGRMTPDLQLVIDALQARRQELEAPAFDVFLDELTYTYDGAKSQCVAAALEARLMGVQYSDLPA